MKEVEKTNQGTSLSFWKPADQTGAKLAPSFVITWADSWAGFCTGTLILAKLEWEGKVKRKGIQGWELIAKRLGAMQNSSEHKQMLVCDGVHVSQSVFPVTSPFSAGPQPLARE